MEPHALDLWLGGRASVPEAAFLAAVDIVLRDDMAREGRAPRTKVLLAVAPGARERLQRVLAAHEVHAVAHLQEAVRELERQKFGMVIIDVYFDDSRMFELLHHVRMNRTEPAVPVVCVLGVEGPFSEVVVEGLDHAAKSQMANGFLDLRKIPDDAQGNARLRRIIDYLILIDGDLHQGVKENS